MYGYKSSLSPYRQAARATTADAPHRVIALLLAGSIKQVRVAEGCLQLSDILGKIEATGAALRIINGLRMSLDHKADSELAQRLDSLYEYCAVKLVQSNTGDDVASLREVSSLLGYISEAWLAISPASVRGLYSMPQAAL